MFCVSKDADNFEPSETIRDAAGRLDRWEGEDEDEAVKVACQWPCYQNFITKEHFIPFNSALSRGVWLKVAALIWAIVVYFRSLASLE